MNVLITGTSTGIGLATALKLSRAGHTVFAGMRKPGRSPQLSEIATAENLPLEVLTLDVDSDDSVAQAIAHIRGRRVSIDALVNNAGIERRGSIEDLPFAEFRAAMETNYFGALRCIQALLPEMREKRSGCIVNISSVAGKIAISPLTPYCATKFALEALSEGLAQEMKSYGIRVAIVEPGIIDTPMARRIAAPPDNSHYPQARRFAGMFEAALSAPASPELVAEKIREILESGTWKLRHPVGPDAEPFLAWRASMTDEEWANWGALDDEAWFERVRQDFGLDAHPGKERSAGA
jgi:NAD(P)-dependent dehydrogenase (short-subunit alcohol dehydrogenase family)